MIRVSATITITGELSAARSPTMDDRCLKCGCEAFDESVEPGYGGGMCPGTGSAGCKAALGNLDLQGQYWRTRALALQEQIARAATVCPKDGCMLWKGHTEPHATAEAVSRALAAESRTPLPCPTCSRQCPIMGGPSIPRSMLLPHERQARENHGQSLAVLASRGGLSPDEALAILDDRKWRRMDKAEAGTELTRRLAAESRVREPVPAAVREAAEGILGAIEDIGDVRAAHLVSADDIALVARYVAGKE